MGSHYYGKTLLGRLYSKELTMDEFQKEWNDFAAASGRNTDWEFWAEKFGYSHVAYWTKTSVGAENVVRDARNMWEGGVVHANHILKAMEKVGTNVPVISYYDDVDDSSLCLEGVVHTFEQAGVTKLVYARSNANTLDALLKLQNLGWHMTECCDCVVPQTSRCVLLKELPGILLCKVKG